MSDFSTMIDRSQANSKLAAMMVQDMAQQDREWIFARLSPLQRRRLKNGLLRLEGDDARPNKAFDFATREETQSTTLPSPRDSVDGSAAKLFSDGPPGIAELSRRDLIALASADQIQKVLENEPVELIAIFLSIENWSWRAVYLSRLDVSRRKNIEAIMLKNNRVPRKLESVLIDQIGACLSPGTEYFLDESDGPFVSSTSVLKKNLLLRLTSLWRK